MHDDISQSFSLDELGQYLESLSELSNEDEGVLVDRGWIVREHTLQQFVPWGN